jgi:N-sulfoglucosamine sulfohydrolase
MSLGQCCLAVCVAVGLTAAAGATPPARPNIVVFMSDDHGYFDTSIVGATDVRTPHLQRLARDGMTFTHAFAASPSCAPSRAALLTGLMPARNGAEANHAAPRPDVKTLPAYLRDLGYEVAAFGKVAHYKMADRFGFDRHDPRHDAAAVADYLAGRDRAKPLCLFVGTHRPHVPWGEPAGYDPATLVIPPGHVDTPQTRAVRARYYADVTRADAELGAAYDLARRELPGALFIYTSDHGAQWPFGKWNLYDAGVRVPFVAAWDGVVKPGTTADAMVSLVDLLPTFVTIAGGAEPAGLDGRSFAAVLRGESARHRDRVFATHSGDGRMNVYPIRCVRTREWKYVLNLHPEYEHTTHINFGRGPDGLSYWSSWEAAAKDDARAAAVVDRYRRRPREELYRVADDPHELTNLADSPEHAKTLAEFREQVRTWRAEQRDAGKVFAEPRLLRPAGSGALPIR